MSELEPKAGNDQPPVGGAATTGPRDTQPSAEGPASGPISESGALPKYCPQCGNEYDAGLSFCPKDGNVLQVRHGEHSLVGQIIGRHYRVLELLGEGGMGQVFLAEHVRIGRRCAIKVMRPALVRDPGAVGRFGREAMTAGRINHRNAVAVYDFGETDDGLIYIVMEHVEGEALSHLLAREGALAPAVAGHIALQITDALVAAHRLGIIHRDLKPDNILVGHDEEGRALVKVVDFGIAKAVNDNNQQTLTKTGFVLGTLQYMSPEQLIGEHLDGRSDIYSLGCILFEMLTGERTFAGPSGPAVVVRRLTEPAPTARSRRPDIPEVLDAIVTKTLARAAADRFQTAEEFRAALLAWLGVAPGATAVISAVPAGVPPATSSVPPAAPAPTPPAVDQPVRVPAAAAPTPPPPAPPTPTPAPVAAGAEPAPAAVPEPEPAVASSGSRGASPDSGPAPIVAPLPDVAETAATAVGVTPFDARAAAAPAASISAESPSPVDAQAGAPGKVHSTRARRRGRTALLSVSAVALAVAAFVVIRAVRQPAADGVALGDAANTQAESVPESSGAAPETPAAPPTATASDNTAANRSSSPPAGNRSAAAPPRPSRTSAPPTRPDTRPAGRAGAGAAASPGKGAERPSTTAATPAAPAAPGPKPLGSAVSAPPPTTTPATTTPAASPPSSAQPAPVVAPPQPSAPAPSEEALRAAAGAQGRRAAEDLAAAIASRQMVALRRAWPDIPPEPARRWREFLLSPDNTNIAAHVVAVRPPSLDNGSASVPFSLAVDFTNRVSGHGTAVSRFTATLARQGGDWALTGIRAGW